MGLRAGRVRKISPPSGFDPWTAHPGRGLRLIFDLYFFFVRGLEVIVVLTGKLVL